MPCSKGGTTFWVRFLDRHVRISESNDLDRVALFSKDCEFFRLARGSLRLVEATESLTGFFHLATWGPGHPLVLGLSRFLSGHGLSLTPTGVSFYFHLPYFLPFFFLGTLIFGFLYLAMVTRHTELC